jgi:hypothetical protein
MRLEPTGARPAENPEAFPVNVASLPAACYMLIVRPSCRAHRSRMRRCFSVGHTS